jgi:transcriptional regulator with XRE-family HTH domain
MDEVRMAERNQDEEPAYVAPEALGRLMKTRRARENLTLQSVSHQTGVSIATLSRLENQSGTSGRTGGKRDAHKLAAVAKWLGVQLDPGAIQIPLETQDPLVHPQEQGTVQFIEAHLRADRNLDPTAAEALARMFQALYDQFSNTRIEERPDLE